MRIAEITALTGPDAIQVAERPDPEPGAGQVRIRVDTAGVNFPDLLMSRGLYQIRPRTPFAAGGEVAGVVDAVGEGVDTLAVGDRVMALTIIGGFATHVVVAAAQAVRVPDAMPLELAGAFAFTYGTSIHGLVDRGQLQAGERLLVTGAAGGVGLAAVELGAALGAEVVAAASTDEKLALCAEHGAKYGINYATQDLKQAAKGLGGVDVVYDAVGGDKAELALRALRPDGRFLVVGFAAGDIPKIGLNLVLLKEIQVVGVSWGAWAMRNPARHAANIQRLFSLYAEGKVKPHVSKTYALDEVPRALHDMDQRKVLGKVVIKP